MKQLYLSLLFIFFGLSSSYSQQAPITFGLGKPLELNKNAGVSGSPYLLPDFQKSELVTPGGRSLNNVQLRYNIYNQTIECSVDQQVYDVSDSIARFHFVESFEYPNIFIRIKSPQIKKPQAQFFEIIYKGKVSLVKAIELDISSGVDWYTKKAVKKFVIKSEYYALVNNELSKLGTNKKSVLNALGNSAKAKGYIDANNDVDFLSDTSLTKLFQYLN